MTYDGQTTFQSTRPRGTRPETEPLIMTAPLFQSTRPRGTRQDMQKKLNGITEFQSTRPRGTRRSSNAPMTRRSAFQSTRPRGTRRDERVRQAPAALVSIHASARDATDPGSRAPPLPRFNPRVRAGRDPRWRQCRLETSCFNPRVRAGRDARAAVVPLARAVSIHASARDATTGI